MARKYYPAGMPLMQQPPPLLSEGRGRQPEAVCFTGHRHLSAAEKCILTARLDRLIEAMWLRGYRTFICGGALGFDTLAAFRVLDVKKRHPELKMVMALPCSDQTKRWSDSDCRVYEHILIHADETHVMSAKYFDGVMQVRNRFMVDHAALCVCYLNQMKGGTMSTVAYALRGKCPVLNIAMEDACAAYIRESMLNCPFSEP